MPRRQQYQQTLQSIALTSIPSNISPEIDVILIAYNIHTDRFFFIFQISKDS